ncbi:preprotein translocase subunit YajC [Balneicella halophila]|uniref:Sec translocon accessory complex subunit YajC n=1 Tax=Balneicella halophila TaxID=1537566 RepID=A0A7L4UNL3_BALHA|nr:preprotein translocase subunit YajC [Balneicella halophila]PVX50773.1 preprotein translocase subunit YajC [Balneicella halophila]
MIALQAGGGMGNMFFLIAMLAVFIFFIILPQFKRQKELKKFRSQLKKGDHVVTTGGILGRVTDIQDDAVTIVTDEKTKLRVAKLSLVKDVNSVAQVR